MKPPVCQSFLYALTGVWIWNRAVIVKEESQTCQERWHFLNPYCGSIVWQYYFLILNSLLFSSFSPSYLLFGVQPFLMEVIYYSWNRAYNLFLGRLSFYRVRKIILQIHGVSLQSHRPVEVYLPGLGCLNVSFHESLGRGHGERKTNQLQRLYLFPFFLLFLFSYTLSLSLLPPRLPVFLYTNSLIRSPYSLAGACLSLLFYCNF